MLKLSANWVTRYMYCPYLASGPDINREGVIAILVPGFPLVKEWAYAGFFFVMSGAAASLVIAGDPVSEAVPSLVLLILTVISWYFRPADRKLASVNQRDEQYESSSRPVL